MSRQGRLTEPIPAQDREGPGRGPDRDTLAQTGSFNGCIQLQKQVILQINSDLALRERYYNVQADKLRLQKKPVASGA
jgi:hypothetical protein